METLLLLAQVAVLLGAIFLGIRLGGMAIGYAGGLGVVILCLFLGMKPGNIPWDVILIIMSVIAAITAMQVAGGLDYMVLIAEKVLRKNPRYINYLAPATTYTLTLLAGTGHTTFSMIPVIVEVAKEQKIRPSVPLSVAVVASQIAITASPVSAAVVYMSGVLEPLGWSYPTLLLVWIITTFAACMLTAFITSMIFPLDLNKDPIYQKRLKAGLIKESTHTLSSELPKGAKKSVLIFFTGVLCVVLYATSISDVVRKPLLNYVNSFIPQTIHEDLEALKRDLVKNITITSKELGGVALSVDKKISALQEDYAQSSDAFRADPNKIADYAISLLETKQSILQDLNDHLPATIAKANLLAQTIESRFMALKIEDSITKEIQNDSLTITLAKFVRSYIDPIRLTRDGAIIAFMLSIAAIIIIVCKVETSRLFETGTFKSGMTACICVLGVAWLGNTFVEGYTKEIGMIAGTLVKEYPVLLSVALFFASMLLYSQAATAKAIIPVVITALGITASDPHSSYVIVASFAAVSALFVLPTYPTLLGAVQMDDTGSTRVGKYIFNHSFLFPGVLAIVIAVALGFIIAPIFA